jgi:hypothetical protein
MNLLQRFYSAVIDASDAFGAAVQGVDVNTHRANLYGHPDGIVAARAARVASSVDVPDRADAEDGATLGIDYPAPFYVARTSDVPLYQTLAEDLENDAQEARWRDLDDADRSAER